MKSQRMCVVCRSMLPKEDLLRIAKTAEGFSIDFEHKILSRGAYICKDKKCLSSARKKSALDRSFSSKVDASIYDFLEGLLENDK